MREFTLRQRMLPNFERTLLRAAFWLAVAALVGLAISYPFILRWDDLMEWGEAMDWTAAAGKALGAGAVALLLVQAVLGARSRWMDRLFGLNTIYIIHRYVAVSVVILATLHPMTVFFYRPLDVGEAGLSLDSWPVLLGSLVLVGFWMTAAFAMYRRFVELPYRAWQLGHRAGTWLLIILAFIHLLSVTDDFRRFPGILAAAIALGLVIALAMRTRLLKKFGYARTPYVVQTVEEPGPDAVTLSLKPHEGARGISFVPGQFAVLLPEATGVPSEEHPFTIASAPDDLPTLSFTIRCCGDFTNTLRSIKPGDAMMVDGPYGRFSYATLAPMHAPLLLVAGGVGITPMLSMLRTMAHEADPRPICLVWSNRSREDVLHAQELKELAVRLENLHIIHVFSRQTMSANLEERSGRLRQSILYDAMEHLPKDPFPHAFLCGPPAMMAAAREMLLLLNMPDSHIHSEAFSF